jgi:hypothetical protein
MEPLAVGIHSVSTIAQVRANQVVAVFGAGPVGLLCMAVAKALGARRVIAIDISESRLEFAKSYSADDIFIPGKMNEGETKMQYSRRMTTTMKEQLGIADDGPNGVDTVIEATGAEVCIQQGYFLLKGGGTFVQVGMGTAEVQVPITLILVKELSVKGSFRLVLPLLLLNQRLTYIQAMGLVTMLSPSPSLHRARSISSHSSLIDSSLMMLRRHSRPPVKARVRTGRVLSRQSSLDLNRLLICNAQCMLIAREYGTAVYVAILH